MRLIRDIEEREDPSDPLYLLQIIHQIITLQVCYGGEKVRAKNSILRVIENRDDG